MLSPHKQEPLPLWNPAADCLEPSTVNPITNKSNDLDPADRPFHQWYRFILSFPPHLVRDYLYDFKVRENAKILDPFCGTGTTLIEAKRQQMQALGIEANPFPHFASTVKVDWAIAPEELWALTEEVVDRSYQTLAQQGIDDYALTGELPKNLRSLPPQAEKALITHSISPLPLHKTVILLEHLNKLRAAPAYKYGLLAIGNALVTKIGNLKFGPEVGVGKLKGDVPVVAIWKHEMQKIIADLQTVQGQHYPQATIYLGDARNAAQLLPPQSIDAVITSPPYPNEKDYTRTTRLESVLLGFVADMAELRQHKKRLLRSNTRGVYVVDDDDQWVVGNHAVQSVANAIEQRRIHLGKTSGFERLYARVTRLYFGGMARHLATLTTVLKPGAHLAYVVGDQASYLQVLIRTGQLLAEIASELGYEVERIDLFRTRFSTGTQAELREEVIVLRWPG
ncbi:MAG: DNA methyltransferase [Anaerolineae bacterium]|nr:DNA methyltransferase [Anaerolineae bacterium]